MASIFYSLLKADKPDYLQLRGSLHISICIFLPRCFLTAPEMTCVLHLAPVDCPVLYGRWQIVLSNCIKGIHQFLHLLGTEPLSLVLYFVMFKLWEC